MIDEEISRYSTKIREYYDRLEQPVPVEAINLLKRLIPYELDFRRTWSGFASLLSRLEYLGSDEIDMLTEFMIDNY